MFFPIKIVRSVFYIIFIFFTTPTRIDGQGVFLPIYRGLNKTYTYPFIEAHSPIPDKTKISLNLKFHILFQSLQRIYFCTNI